MSNPKNTIIPILVVLDECDDCRTERLIGIQSESKSKVTTNAYRQG